MNTPSASSRLHAITLLDAVLGGRQMTLDAAQAAMPFAGCASDAAFVRHLVLRVLRHRGQLDALLTRYLAKPLAAKHHAAQHGLRLGVAQLLLLGTPPHAAVHETVAAVKLTRSARLDGLVNAVLQKIVAENPPLPSPGHNLPAWWGTRLDAHYGAGVARAIASVAAQLPPLDLNLPAPAVMECGERLDESMWRMPPDYLPVETLPGYGSGVFFVQDFAASYPVRLLGEVTGRRVLDLCAAPGGKTMQLARAGAKVTALDRSEQRLQRLRQNMQRMQLQAEIITADALTWQPEGLFDAILLDAPCTATGTWRRHPEVVRLASPESIAELAAMQCALLARAWVWLKPGGRLVYCTCSLEPEEGEHQITAFLAGQKDASLIFIAPQHSSCPEGERDLLLQTRGGSGLQNIPSQFIRHGMLRTLPSMLAAQGGMDGFFAAALRKHECGDASNGQR